MNEKNRNLVVRIVTALVLLPVVLTLLVLGGWWTAGLVATAAAGCALEYQQRERRFGLTSAQLPK